jgi:hypothetical protein
MDEGKDKIAQHVRNSYTRVSASMPKQGNVEVPQTSTESVAEEIFKEQKGVRTQVPSVIQTVGKYRAKPELSPADLKKLGQMGLSEDMLIKDPELMDLFMGKKAKIKPTWNSMDKEQSILNDRIVAIRAAHEGKDTTATHYLGRLRSAILEDMEVYAKQQGSSTWNLYLKAKAAAKFQHDVFNKDILKIMGKNPEDIVDSVIRKGKDSTTYLRQVHMATGDAGIEPLKSVSSARLFENSRKTGVLGDVIDPTLLKKNWDNIPVDTRDMLFSKAEQSLVDNVIQKGQKIAYQMKGAKTSQFINRIVNAEPQSVVDMILEAKAESNANIARKVLPKARLDEVRSKLMERILKMSGEGKLLVSASNKEFQKYDPVLRELMREPGGNLSQRYFGLKRFLSLEENMKRASQLAVNASQTGQVLLGSQLASSVLRAGVGAVVGGATSGPGERGGGALTGAAASLALPWVIAKIYTSDAASKYFTRAISMNPGSKQAIELFIKAILALGRPESEQQPNVAKEQPNVVTGYTYDPKTGALVKQ